MTSGPAADTTASTVAQISSSTEGSIAPATTLDYQDAEAKAASVAHYTKLLRNQLADLPSLQQVVEGRLVHGVLRRLEDQIVAGDGLGENLRGILTYTQAEHWDAVPVEPCWVNRPDAASAT